MTERISNLEVTYIDHMGDDLRVVNAARVSFHKESEWEQGEEHEHVDYGSRSVWYIYDKILSEGDQKLIKYLATHNHWTPFSHVQITLREKVPIFVARQRFKHMVGFTYNEISRRYVDDTPEFFIPTEWRKRADNKKQGSSDETVGFITWKTFTDEKTNEYVVQGRSVKVLYDEFIDSAEHIYNMMIEGGIAPEQARMVLPQSMMTEYYCTGSLAAWARAYNLRSDPHSQYEIQYLAMLWNQTIGEIKELEHSWKALTNLEDHG